MKDHPRTSQHSQGDGNALVGGNVNGPLTINNFLGPREVGPDEAALQRSYLQWVMDECRPLSLAAIDYSTENPAAPSLGLDQIYTALMTNWRDRSSDESREAALSDDLQSLASGRQREASAVHYLDANRRAVLLGAPGSGKSTFVNFVALCLAGELLQKADINLVCLTAPLPDDEGKGKGKDQEEQQIWSSAVPIPVRVILRDFAASGHLPSEGAKPDATALWSHIKDMLASCDKADYLSHLRRRMLAGEVLLLLDGLDEVAEAEKRREQVVGAIRAFAAAHGDARILVTARPYAYQQARWRLEGFSDAALTDFSDGQIRRFIRRWYAGQSRDQDDNAGRAILLEQAIFSRDKGRLLALARRPLLLTLMARLHSEKPRELPDKRVELYADVLDLLLHNWDARRFKVDAHGRARQDQPALSEYLNVGPKAVRAVLERLAFVAHRDQASATETADIPEHGLVAALLAINPDNKEIRPRQLMDYLEHRTGVLVPRAPGVYTFPHRSFQEYLAACHLNREDLDLGDFDDEAALIADLGRRDPDRWREVVVLATATAPWLAWEVADLLLPELPAEGQLSIQDAWGARLGGQILLESTDYAKANPKRTRIRDRIRDGQLAIMRRSSLPAPERAAAGDCLAALGDPRFDPQCNHLPADPLLGFVRIPAGSFTMGSDKDESEDTIVPEYPRHRLTLPTYWIGRWPVTVAQFRDFVESSGYTHHDESALHGPETRPVVDVSWRDARAYCAWLDLQLRELVSVTPTGTLERPEVDELHARIRSGTLHVRLPSEPEWEKAARGTNARRYPWGEQPDTECANCGREIGEASVVGCYPKGSSPFGCEEMSGNVWEWTRSAQGHYPYPESGPDLQERECADGALPRMLRGGAFDDNPGSICCAYRVYSTPDFRIYGFGFRVVLSPFPLDSESSDF